MDSKRRNKVPDSKSTRMCGRGVTRAQVDVQHTKPPNITYPRDSLPSL